MSGENRKRLREQCRRCQHCMRAMRDGHGTAWHDGNELQHPTMVIPYSNNRVTVKKLLHGFPRGGIIFMRAEESHADRN